MQMQTPAMATNSGHKASVGRMTDEEVSQRAFVAEQIVSGIRRALVSFADPIGMKSGRESGIMQLRPSSADPSNSTYAIHQGEITYLAPRLATNQSLAHPYRRLLRPGPMRTGLLRGARRE
jgi:hypothetical protein